MSNFLRSFALTFALTVLIIFAAVFMEIIYSEAQENGFCEGELFSVSADKETFSAEILGERFSLALPPSESLKSAAAKVFLPLLLPLRPAIWLINSLFM